MIWRKATRTDVPAIVVLLADDGLGRTREKVESGAYLRAFDAMLAEGANHLIVAERDERVVATYQITFISGLSLTAKRRAQIEAVRVASDLRGHGIGEQLFADAEARARGAGCGLMQLTSNAWRTEAHRFYERLGFTPSHIGFKKPL